MIGVGARIRGDRCLAARGQELVLARMFYSLAAAIVNTAASARCGDELAHRELFQQFVSGGEKPLKRLVRRCLPFHRAKAAVLMRVRMLRPSGLGMPRARIGPSLVTLLGVLICLFAIPAFAKSPGAAFDAANRLYEQGKFSEAANAYEKLVQQGRVSEALYFNLGNAFFKSGQIGRAIGAYQKAEQFAPRDPDLRANLQFARNQVQGPTLVPDKLGTWLGRLSLNEWTGLAAACLWSWLLLLTLGQLRPALRPAVRPYALWLGLGMIVVLGCCGAALYFDRLVSHAIVIAPEATARQAPLDESQPAFTLHDGAEVEVLDQKDQWLQVEVDRRRTGWVHRDLLN